MALLDGGHLFIDFIFVKVRCNAGKGNFGLWIRSSNEHNYMIPAHLPEVSEQSMRG